jgi:hypothetical protein
MLAHRYYVRFIGSARMRESKVCVRLSLLVAAASVLIGCASPPLARDPSGAVRRTVSELAALRPADMRATLSSREGERSVFETEIAAMRAVFALPDGSEFDTKLPEALSSAALFNVEKDAARAALLRALPRVHEKPAAFQRGILTAAHTQFWNESALLLPALLPQIKTPREFAIAAYTLLRANSGSANKQIIAENLRENFPEWSTEPRLIALDSRLRIDPTTQLQQRPSLADLLAAPFKPGYPVVFSFQRRDRERTGMAMVRAADGRFVRKSDGSYFTIAQLALARSNLPGTITNGNTPQGVFVIKGTGTATNRWIGPTPYLESMLPIEAKVHVFSHQPTETAEMWNEAAYDSFLPASWRNYFPMKEAFLAGRAGRDEILAHGNTVNSSYYKDEPYFPAAPSAGCLVAMEYWSKEDGTLVHSDQLGLVKAFVTSGTDRGYLVVVEIDDKARPVIMADVVDAVIAAEQTVRRK